MDFSPLNVVIVMALLSSVDGFCAGDRKLNGDLVRAAVKAANYLKGQMDDNGTFGTGHLTAYAFNSLRLAGYHEMNNASELGAEYLGKDITHLGIEDISGGRLAFYILGILSSCKDPKHFIELNLVEALKTKLGSYPTTGFNHPYPFYLALLALCASGEDIDPSYVDKLADGISHANSSSAAHGVDTLCMGIMAMSCIRRNHQADTKMKDSIEAAITDLKAMQAEKGGKIGNEYSTSKAVKAMKAVGVDDMEWNCSFTMRYLLSMQKDDGSFVGVYGTIQALPALIGALSYDVTDLPCPKVPGPVDKPKNITVCIKLEFEDGLVNKTAPPPEYFTVLNGTNAHNLLKLAKHPCYNFTVSKTSWGHSVTSICGVSKNHDLKLYWTIYTTPEKSASYGIDHLKPVDGSCVVFRYKKLYW